MFYSSQPWPDKLSLTRLPACPGASTRDLGLGSTYSVSQCTCPPQSLTESGETHRAVGRVWVRTVLPHVTLAGDGHFTRTRLVGVAQGLPDMRPLCVPYFSCTYVENYLENLLD